MMVASITHQSAAEITTAMPYAHGLHFCALWWMEFDARRRMSSLGECPGIVLRVPGGGTSSGPTI
jgi:hypothetical protein